MLTGGQIQALVLGTIAKQLGGREVYGNKVKRWVLKGPSVDRLWKLFSSREPSDKRSEVYDGFGKIPKVQRWDGTQGYGSAPELTVTITNFAWWAGFGHSEDIVRWNKLRQPLINASQLGQRIAHHEDELLLGVLLDPDTSARQYTCYDGKSLFSTAHKKGASTQSNYFNAGSGDVLTSPNFMSACTMMDKLTDIQGQEEAGFFPTLALAGVDYRFTLWDIVANALRLVTSASPVAGAAVPNALTIYSIDMAIVPHTVPTDYWSVHDTSDPDVQAVAFQVEKEPEYRTNAGDENHPYRMASGMIVHQNDANYGAGAMEPLAAVRGK